MSIQGRVDGDNEKCSHKAEDQSIQVTPEKEKDTKDMKKKMCCLDFPCTPNLQVEQRRALE